MPELPEVEVVRRGLAGQLIGRRIESAEVFHERTLRGWDPQDFCRRLTGWGIKAAVRRGKFLWLLGDKESLANSPVNDDLVTKNPLANQPVSKNVVANQTVTKDSVTNSPVTYQFVPDYALLIHLGMSGQCLVNPPGTKLDTRAQSHLRIRLTCEDGWTLNFIDQRTFGRFTWNRLVPTRDGAAGGAGSDLPFVPETIAKQVARDCLDPALDLEAVTERLKARKAPIKNLLLDQSIVSGIGNIYADESLFDSKVHPLSEPARLTLATFPALFEAAKAVMDKALAVGGTSFDALYVNTSGDPGYFARSLSVYGRKGLPCRLCETPLEQLKLAGRSATFCPNCQQISRRKARKPRSTCKA